MPEDVRRIAEDIDDIRWRNFVESKVPRSLFKMQGQWSRGVDHSLPPATWAKGFITQLIHLSHSQWLYRNFSLHDRATGYLRRMTRQRLLLKVSELANTDPLELPPVSRFLLEIDFAALGSVKQERQSYWLLALKAANELDNAWQCKRRSSGARPDGLA